MASRELSNLAPDRVAQPHCAQSTERLDRKGRQRLSVGTALISERQFRLEPDQIVDVIAYLKALERRHDGDFEDEALSRPYRDQASYACRTAFSSPPPEAEGVAPSSPAVPLSIASFTMQVSGSCGSGAMSKPSSRHIASIVVFSLSTWPSMVFRPSARAYSMISLHQQPAEAAALEIGADQDGIFAAVVVRIGVQAHHAEHLAGRFVDRDERHGARVVDLGEARDEGVAEFLHRREEAQAQVLRRHRGKERPVQRLVLRPHRPDKNRRFRPAASACRSHSLG